MASDSSDESGDEAEFQFYSNRPEWADVTPIAQPDGPTPIVQVAYSKKFLDIYGYLRAVLASGERSERVLALTKDAAAANPANYTVWQLRRDTLRHCRADLNAELNYTGRMIRKQPKNYQVWHHRQVLVDWLDGAATCTDELKFIDEMLRNDAKNYHAWQYRQWLINRFDAWDGELDAMSAMIAADVLNNSAWSHRYHVINITTGFLHAGVLGRELEFVTEAVRRVPNNESVWNYLRGLFLTGDTKASENAQVWDIVDVALKENCDLPLPSAFRLELLEERLEGMAEGSERDETLKSALEICESLEKKIDMIRRRYWHYIRDQLIRNFGGGMGDASGNEAA